MYHGRLTEKGMRFSWIAYSGITKGLYGKITVATLAGAKGNGK